MYMLQLNDLLQPSEWEPYWTIYGNDHEGLIKGAEYVIFEYYCTEAKCNCENIKVEIKQLGNDGEPIEESLAILNYNLSSKNKCHPDLDEASPKTAIAFRLLEIYKEFIHFEDYLIRIKEQYSKVKKLAFKKNNTATQEISLNAYKGVNRNDKCPCGSNKKYKKCCLDKLIIM